MSCSPRSGACDATLSFSIWACLTGAFCFGSAAHAWRYLGRTVTPRVRRRTSGSPGERLDQPTYVARKRLSAKNDRYVPDFITRISSGAPAICPIYTAELYGNDHHGRDERGTSTSCWRRNRGARYRGRVAVLGRAARCTPSITDFRTHLVRSASAEFESRARWRSLRVSRLRKERAMKAKVGGM